MRKIVAGKPNQLSEILRARIEAEGPISVAAFMDLALQHPEFGYYQRGIPLGLAGDFITAPEISQMFGEMLGLFVADMWRQMGAPASFTLLELGPGRGTLMQDMLRATAKITDFQQALKLHMMESNVTLRKEQEAKLFAYHPTYIDSLSQLPPEPILIVANEFFDALPVHQFEKNFQGWGEQMVGLDDHGLTFQWRALKETELSIIPRVWLDARPGTFYEVSEMSFSILHALANKITQHGGAMLISDYGYAEAAGAPTVQAVSKHVFANPLNNPGDQDLTAHVDFGALKTVARGAGALVHGPLGQGDFLRALGIEIRADQLKKSATPSQARAIEQALHRLLDVNEMGQLFKMMVVSSTDLKQVPGF